MTKKMKRPKDLNPAVVQEIKEEKQHVKIRFKPANQEQDELVQLLRDESVRIIFVDGRAGTGKTLCAVATGMDLVLRGHYRHVTCYRPLIEIGKSLGAIPGDLSEKLDVWFEPIYDNLSFITDSNTVTSLKQKDKLRLEAASLMRGRSLHNAFIVCDESQNFTWHELLTMITRTTDSSKMVFLYDPHQSDRRDSGINDFVEHLKNGNIPGIAFCNLKISQRSPIVDAINNHFENINPPKKQPQI